MPRSGSRFWARIRLSTEGLRKGRPYFRQPSAMKPMSKSALWAARGRSPAKSRKARRASFWEGAPTSISSVMPVSMMISWDRIRPGAAKVLNRSAISPFFRRTAPISMMTSRFLFRPVVSMSKQTISSEKAASVSPWTTTRSSTSLMK